MCDGICFDLNIAAQNYCSKVSAFFNKFSAAAAVPVSSNQQKLFCANEIQSKRRRKKNMS